MEYSKIVVDTSILVASLRGGLPAEVLYKTIEGRAPMVSPITVHELRRGARPGSRWETQIERLVPASTVLTAPPSADDWLEAADVIRACFARSRPKTELASLAHDVLIALTARGLAAELWSRDRDFAVICEALNVRLLAH